MPTIHKIHWAKVEHDKMPLWTRTYGTLYAVWPAPVNGDACFEKAGFSDFECPEEQIDDWDNEFEELVNRLLMELEKFGEPKTRTRDTYIKAGFPPKKFLGIFPRKNKPPDPKDEIEANSLFTHVITPTYDDNFKETIIDYGNPSKVSLRTSDGHEILWFDFAPREDDVFQNLLKVIADGRPSVETVLKWDSLL